jgi:hypothetical protein
MISSGTVFMGSRLRGNDSEEVLLALRVCKPIY